jgi:hypothetical protein
MRELWDEWNTNVNEETLFTCNACKVYMDYMYKTYPPGFGENLHNAIRNLKKGEKIDATKIFSQLIMKND